MEKQYLIKDVTDLVVFEPAIKLQSISADLNNSYFKDYIITQDLANVYEKILSSILGDGWSDVASELAAERRRSHLISAQYGTGKSYFLMILSALLDASKDDYKLQQARGKFERFPTVRNLLSKLADKKFLVIQISAEDKGDIRFKELLVSSLIRQISKIVPDVAFSNEYTEATSHLEEMESKQVGPTFAKVLNEQFEVSLQQLRAKLGNYNREGLRIYYQACKQVLGREVSRDSLDIETTFQEALELLKPKGITHIAVIIDELTAYLKASAGHYVLADTLGELQTFAAYCNKVTSRCLFVGAMHLAMRDFLQEQALLKEYEKMMGRFEEPRFPIHSSELLARVFQPKATFDEVMQNYRDQVKKLNELITTFKLEVKGEPMKLSAFFPLHPAVAHYLPLVSRVLGQAERTSFGFISEKVRPLLGKPLVKEKRLNLVTLNHVFDYFLPAMEQIPYYVQVITAYNIVQSKIKSSLAHEAFKPLALIWLASRGYLERPQMLHADLSSEEVAEFIGIYDDLAVMDALEELCKTGYIYYDRSTQKYFYSPADPAWDLESEIQKRFKDIDPNKVLRAELQRLGSQVDVNVLDTKPVVKVERTIEYEWLDVAQIKGTTTIKPKHAEGKVVFIIPDVDEAKSYGELFSDVNLKARDLSRSNVIVGLPKKVDMLNVTDLRRYQALQEIADQLGVDRQREGQESLQEYRIRQTGARLSEVKERVTRHLDEFGQASNFIFFVDRQPHEAQDLETVLANMFERHYYKFPKIKAERINGRNTTNALIQSCIVNLRSTFAANDTSEAARHARDTLQVLGLCSWNSAAGGKFEIELKEPEPRREGYEIWKIVLDTLTSSIASPFGTLYSRLSEAPYGLPDYMVELYIAAVLALKKAYVLDKSGKMPAVSKALVADITKRKDKDYQVLPAETTEVPYTFICSVWKAIDEVLGVRYYQELEKNLGRTVDEQKIWLALKQDSNNFLQNRLFANRMNDRLKDIDAESPSLTKLIKHLEEVRYILLPAQGFNQLAALGEDLSGVRVKDDPDTAASAIVRTIADSDQFLKDWPVLQPACVLYHQLRRESNLERYGELERQINDAWQTYRSEALPTDKREAFIEQFKKLWKRYAEDYVDEHNAVSKTRAGFGKKIEQSSAYELLREFSQMGYQGIATKSTFDTKIRTEREQACTPLTDDAMLDYKQFGRTVCPTCSYQRGTNINVLEQLQENEVSLFTSISNALESYIAKTNELLISDSIQVYAKEQATADQKTVIASVQELTSKGQPPSDTDSKKLATLLPASKTILAEAETYVRGQARKRKELERQLEEEEKRKRIPRVPTFKLADSVRAFLMDSGFEAMTLKELEERLTVWMQEIVDEFRQRD